jgi:excisionase family DNA binding protein
MSSTVPRGIYPRTIRLQSLAASVLAFKQEINSVLAQPMVSAPEFAASMNVSVVTVYRWLRQGTVKGYRSGRTWWKIPVSEVKRLKGLE